MKHEIEPTPFPTLHLQLTDGEAVFTTDTSAAWMTPNIDIKTGTRGALGARMTGEAITATTYTCTEGIGHVTFTAGLPGTIIEQPLRPTGSVMVQQGALLVAQESVRSAGTQTKRLDGTFHGAQGYSVQRFSGPGLIFVLALGGVTERQLEPRETLLVEPAHLVMFDATVKIDIAPARSGQNLAAAASERMHLARMAGPGKIWLQAGSRAFLRALAHRDY